VPKQRILNEAFKLFSNGDYDSVSLADIAEKVGIKKPSIYAHFSSKEELFLSIVDGQLQRLYSFLDDTFNNNKFSKVEIMLYEFLKKCMEYAIINTSEMRFLNRILYSPPIDLVEQIINRTTLLNEKIHSIQSQLMKHGIENGEIKEQDLDNILYTFTTFLRGNFAMALVEQSFSLEKFNFCWQIYWNGIKN
jgi:AcrR family transcriptional regulator